LLMAENIADEMMYLEEKLGIKQVGWSVHPGRWPAAPRARSAFRVGTRPDARSAARQFGCFHGHVETPSRSVTQYQAMSDVEAPQSGPGPRPSHPTIRPRLVAAVT